LQLVARDPTRPVTSELDGAFFPIPPEFKLVCGASQVDQAGQPAVSSDYRKLIDAYLAELGAGSPGAGTGGPAESISQLLFADYCAMVTRGVVGTARQLLRTFPHALGTGTVPTLSQIAKPYGVTVAAIVAANQSAPGLLPAAALPIAGIAHQIRDG